jgi:cortexillin 1/2
MSTKDIKEKGWENVQIKAFTSWVNSLLEHRDLKIQDIKTDLSDGVKLMHFLELLSGKKVPKYTEKPPSRIQKIENLHIALQFVEKEMGVRPTISAEEFADENLKMILGFMWTLFKKYRIQTIKQDDKSSEEGLLLWCKKTTEGYRDVNIESYKYSFRSGMAFLALCDKFIENPELLNYDNFQKDNSVENLSTAFELAEKHMGVPKLLDPNEVAEGNVDERSLVLYISLYFHAFVAKQQQKAILEEKERVEREMKGLQGSLEDRAKTAKELSEINKQLSQQMEELKINLEKEKNEKEQERLEKEKLLQELENLKKKNEELNQQQVLLENKISGLEGQVSELSQKFSQEVDSKTSLATKFSSYSEIQNNALNELRKHLEIHIDDLHRWQKYLDYDKPGEINFSEIKSEVLSQIIEENFEQQLNILTKKLEKENSDIQNLLKTKEAEAKARKEQEKKKRERQKKNED